MFLQHVKINNLIINFMYTYKEMLTAFDGYLADYGNQDLETPEDFGEFDGDIDSLTEEQCKILFEYNNGCIESMTELLDENSEE